MHTFPKRAYGCTHLLTARRSSRYFSVISWNLVSVGTGLSQI
jgi:hypothetical protein